MCLSLYFGVHWAIIFRNLGSKHAILCRLVHSYTSFLHCSTLTDTKSGPILPKQLMLYDAVVIIALSFLGHLSNICVIYIEIFSLLLFNNRLAYKYEERSVWMKNNKSLD